MHDLVLDTRYAWAAVNWVTSVLNDAPLHVLNAKFRQSCVKSPNDKVLPAAIENTTGRDTPALNFHHCDPRHDTKHALAEGDEGEEAAVVGLTTGGFTCTSVVVVALAAQDDGHEF